jgi:hypothetical protein
VCFAQITIFKKFIGEKLRFSNTKKVLVATISPSKAQNEMISYTFLLPCKNEEKNMTAFLIWSRSDPNEIRKRYQAIMTALWPMFRSWRYFPGQRFAVKKVNLTKNSC